MKQTKQLLSTLMLTIAFSTIASAQEPVTTHQIVAPTGYSTDPSTQDYQVIPPTSYPTDPSTQDYQVAPPTGYSTDPSTQNETNSSYPSLALNDEPVMLVNAPGAQRDEASIRGLRAVIVEIINGNDVELQFLVDTSNHELFWSVKAHPTDNSIYLDVKVDLPKYHPEAPVPYWEVNIYTNDSINNEKQGPDFKPGQIVRAVFTEKVGQPGFKFLNAKVTRNDGKDIPPEKQITVTPGEPVKNP